MCFSAQFKTWSLQEIVSINFFSWDLVNFLVSLHAL